MKKLILLLITHLVVAAMGFAAGIYALPVLVAPPAPTASEINRIAEQAKYSAEFRRDVQDSDMLHWGEGTVYVSSTAIALQGKLAPGPDYKLYLSSEHVETEKDFKRLKNSMQRIGDVKTFNNFIVPVPTSTDVTTYTSVIIWCEAFQQFITAAKYQ